MDYTTKEVLQFVAENDVKFVRLAFCDIFGTLKNLSILSDELPRAFEKGISFDAVGIGCFDGFENSELLLFPDPATLTVLPWRPQEGSVARLFCDIKKADGTPFLNDTRNFLKNAINQLGQLGYTAKIGSECEFYLFKTDEYGDPTFEPQDIAGYLDVAPLDKGENVRRDICLTLEQMSLAPRSSHHEKGPGQNEIVFMHSEALESADNVTTFKSVVKAIAERNGLYASFMPKPLANQPGSGMHINISLFNGDKNIIKDGAVISQTGKYFLGGIMKYIKEITLFLNPLANSYTRFGSCEAPKFISYSDSVTSSLLHIPSDTGDAARIELRSPDASTNHYLAFALLLMAGIDGIKNKILPKSDDKPDTLPMTLEAAIDLAKSSKFVNSVLPNEITNKYVQIKLDEWELHSSSDVEKQQLLEKTFLYV